MASKSRKNKVKFKLTKELVILVVGLLVIIAATIIMGLPSNASKTLERYNSQIAEFNTKNSTNHYELPEDHVFKEISYNGLTKKKNNDGYTYVIYGSFNQGTFVENIYSINMKAKDLEIGTIYLFFNDWVANEEDTDSIEFNNEASQKNAVLNEKKNPNQDEFDIADISDTTILVFKAGELVFNTQTYADNDSYSWETLIHQALMVGVDTSK